MAHIYLPSSKSHYVVPKDDDKDRIRVEVGDSKDAADYHPQAKIMRWDNEANISFRLTHDHIPGNISYSQSQGIITWTKGQWEAKFYEDWGTPEGAYKFVELVLPARPPTNEISFTVQSKDVDFLYQPALTPEEIAEGAERPENVVGSYAIYSKSSGGLNRADGKEYKAGKVGHLYRAYLEDANGDRTWAEYNTDLNDTGILTITVDQSWLDNAVYPVILDPTIGYITEGGSFIGINPDGIRGSFGTTDASGGDVSDIRFYGKSSTSQVCKLGVYKDSDSTVLSPQSSELTIDSSTAQWWNDAFSGPTLAASTDYMVSLFANGATLNQVQYAYDSGGPANSSFYMNTTYDTWPSPASWTESSTYRSIYATYTASSPEPNIYDSVTTTESSTVTVNAPTTPTIDQNDTVSITEDSTPRLTSHIDQNDSITLTESSTAALFSRGTNSHSFDITAASDQGAVITDVSQNGVLDLSTNFTIEAWVTLASHPTDWTHIVTKDELSDRQYNFSINGGDTNDPLRCFYFDASSNITQFEGPETSGWTLGDWHHVAVAVTVSATPSMTFYVDGSPSAGSSIATNASSIRNGTADFCIGRRSYTGFEQPWNGKIDEVRVWSDIRTETEINDNMETQLLGNEENLVGYWRLNNDLTDKTLNGNNLSNVNSTPYSTDIPFPAAAGDTLQVNIAGYTGVRVF